jgi:hypothetical protein
MSVALPEMADKKFQMEESRPPMRVPFARPQKTKTPGDAPGAISFRPFGGWKRIWLNRSAGSELHHGKIMNNPPELAQLATGAGTQRRS